MAPPKAETTAMRDDAIGLLLEFLDDERGSLRRREQVTEAASTVKGLFTRSFKQDQWDWFLVFVRLGRPARRRSRRLAAALGDLGRGLRSFDDTLVAEARQVLLHEGGVTALRAYQAGTAPLDPGYGFVYVLSTREQPDLLKIGYTERAVEQRVNEINRATGVVVPYGARGVWRVRSARDVEAAIHAALHDYRVRADREFFHVPFREAARAIDRVVRDRRLEP